MNYGNMFAQPQASGSQMLPPTAPGFNGFPAPGPALPYFLNNLFAQQQSSAPFAQPKSQLPQASWSNPLQQQQSNSDVDNFTRSDEYDKVLVDGLRAARTYGISYLTAINCIPSTPGRSVSWWKLYYLEHMRRIDRLINSGGTTSARASGSSSNNPAKPTSKRPSTSGDIHHAISLAYESKPRPGPSSSKRKARSPTPVSESEHSSAESEVDDDDDDDEESAATPSPPRTRRRLPSLKKRNNDTSTETKPAQRVWRKHVYHLHIPKALPSAPPSPPAPVRTTRGFAFTDEDKAFFINTLLWGAKQGSALTKTQYIEKLAKQAPHHTVMSWGTFWNRAEPKGGVILEEGFKVAKRAAKGK
ncbi:hypothetical protein PENSPDRAFT_691569 [Peniophora sp. CONT]|nr:hypothetical protein PENSPDRAFT_691569 [Peniophora sp. CONT]